MHRWAEAAVRGVLEPMQIILHYIQCLANKKQRDFGMYWRAKATAQKVNKSYFKKR